MSKSDFAVLVDIDGGGSHPAADTFASLADSAAVTTSVRSAERAGFTAVVFPDHPLPDGRSRVDAVQRAAFSAPTTGSIGLIPVVHSVYNEPFHVATQLATLDTVSHGRAGWIVGSDPDPAIAARYGRTPLPDGAVGEEVRDVVEAVRRLWDSWEDDAVIRDTATGRYFDRDRLHFADFVGERFSVKGPSILPRSPQGQTLVLGDASAAAELDVALINSDLGAMTAEAEAARSRHGEAVGVVLSLRVALDRAGRSAADCVAQLDAVTPWHGTPTRPAPAEYVGDAAGLVSLLSGLSETVDGVRILPALLDDVDEVGRAVLPRLREHGLFTSPRTGTTLRQSLGLAHPVNRFAEVSR